MKDPLSPYLDAAGKLLRLPRKAAARTAALDLLAAAFAPARAYTEAEVNAVLADLHTFGDHALLRRELYETRRLTRTRDGRSYHKIAGTFGPVSFRPLSAREDAAIVADQLDASGDYVRHERGLTPGPDDIADFFDAPAASAPEDRLTYLLLDAERQPIGLMAALRSHPTSDVWFIGTLLIDVRARGQGYGTATARWIAAEALASGATALQLCVIETNPRGRAFWHRQGFAEIAQTPDWTAGTRTHRRILLERRLEAAPPAP